ncbi:hypothetical protein N0V95_001416 [Ascochyta clinopodiicola]|nr:hypothetical protein N0V95_001416 [Ascochyta clinopodiicola]
MTGPRVDSYRAGRSPPRRSSPPPRRASPPPRRASPPRRGLASADTYTPGGNSRPSRPRTRSPAFRRRSRSPRRDDNWRARPRSPPRRNFSPRRDDFRNDRPRSPLRRDGYDSYIRSPRPRDRSPPPRTREASPARSRGVRSPVRATRYDEPRSRINRYASSSAVGERPHFANQPSPRRTSPPLRDNRDFRRRSPSPRRERADPYTADTWRSRRSPSARPAFTPNEPSGVQSAATSRRSSPRPTVHPSRAALVDDRPAREPVSAPRSPFREREPSGAPRDNFRERERERSPPRRREASPMRDRSPPRRRDASPPRGPRGDRDREFAPPTGPSSARRNGDGDFPRAPPTGPSSRSYPSPAISPPAGPASSAPTAPPAGPRGGNPALSAPTRPRGGGRGGYPYDAPRDFSGPPRRGSWGAGPRGGGDFRGGFRGGFHDGPPSGPRGSASGPSSFSATFRGSNNSTATTYPRTMRFRDHLADLPKEIPGGQRAPEVYDKSKILRLEDEARKLRDLIDKKEDAKRAKLREWDALEKDAETAQLRVDLAEQSLRNLNGETEVGGAAF